MGNDFNALINLLLIIGGISSFVFYKTRAQRAESKLIDMEIARRRKEIREQVVKYTDKIAEEKSSYEQSKNETLDIIKRIDNGDDTPAS